MKNPDEIQSILKQLIKADLNDSQTLFIKSLNKWYKKTGTVSEKQQNSLKSIFNQVTITI